MSTPESTKRRAVLANCSSQLPAAEDRDEVVAAAHHCDGDTRTLEPQDLPRNAGVELARSLVREARGIDVDERGRVPLESALCEPLGQARTEAGGGPGERERAPRRARLVAQERGDGTRPVGLDRGKHLERTRPVSVERVDT